MASRALIFAARRSVLTTRLFHLTAAQQGGATPPLPPFARSPRKSETLPENWDAVWDDGVAPELALDFDMPNTTSAEALATLGLAFTGLFTLVQGLKFATNNGIDNNPALPQHTDGVAPDYAANLRLPVEEE